MSRTSRPAPPLRRQRGQSMTEYAVICGALATFLFILTPVGQQLTQAIRTFYADVTLFISLP